MKAIIVSDLHIGSRYFLHENFAQFLKNIPEDAEFILNGDIVDNPYAKMFIKAFKMMHDLRVKLGARPVHVAQYAKKWKSFYEYLRKSVMLNAVNYAAENGFEAVSCGHTHSAEEQFVNGIKYLNTGAWTERPTYYVCATANEMTLKKTTDSAELLKFPGTDTVHVSSAHHQNPTQVVSRYN